VCSCTSGRAELISPYQDEEVRGHEAHDWYMSSDSRQGETYEIRVQGELSDQMVAALGGSRPAMTATTIVIVVEDRSALHSVIRRVEDLSLELLSVTPRPSEAVQ
jgi:hypothetical protein